MANTVNVVPCAKFSLCQLPAPTVGVDVWAEGWLESIHGQTEMHKSGRTKHEQDIMVVSVVFGVLILAMAVFTCKNGGGGGGKSDEPPAASTTKNDRTITEV